MWPQHWITTVRAKLIGKCIPLIISSPVPLYSTEPLGELKQVQWTWLCSLWFEQNFLMIITCIFTAPACFPSQALWLPRWASASWNVQLTRWKAGGDRLEQSSGVLCLYRVLTRALWVVHFSTHSILLQGLSNDYHCCQFLILEN